MGKEWKRSQGDRTQGQQAITGISYVNIHWAGGFAEG